MTRPTGFVLPADASGAMQLTPAGPKRIGELRAATLDEFDLEASEWRIPANRTKLRVEHIVPLADQAVAILDDLFRLTGSESGYVFPSVRSRATCMSNDSAHAERNKVRSAYNHASYLPQRQEMMQFWVD